MNLKQEIDARKKEITTDGYPMSIGELVSLYNEGAIDVHPEFQRFFRWKDLQKSLLIESILLGIPIPPIFVSQRNDGVWDVVDGQQRLSTLFEFMGVLRNSAGDLMPASKLVETKYLPSLKDIQWDNPDDTTHEFTRDLKFIFKREKIDIKIVKRESDESMKYELFQRLNTLGSKLSDQEVRNCLLVMLNTDFYNWLIGLALSSDFLETVSLAERLLDEQYNVELVLRFLILKNIDLDEIKSTQDLGEYITDKMVKFCQDPDFNYEQESREFMRTFEILSYFLSSNAFKRYNHSKGRFEGSFLVSGFEAIGIAMGRNFSLWEGILLNEDTKLDFKNKVVSLWENSEFQGRSGSGVNVARRVPTIIPVGESILVP